MSSYAYNSKEESTPSASFQKLCQQLLDGSSQSITKQNIEDFRVILHMIMHDCSKANIEAGKIWIFDHCQTPQHMSAMLEYIQTLALSRSGQKDRIHMVYLVNDVLYHSTRKQKDWMKEAMVPFLVPIVKSAYDAADSPEYKAKVMKVINIWSDKSILDQQLISNIKRTVSGHAAGLPAETNYIQQQQQQQQPKPIPSPYTTTPLTTHAGLPAQQPQPQPQHPPVLHPFPTSMHAPPVVQPQQQPAYPPNPMFLMRPPLNFPPPHPQQQQQQQQYMRPPPPPPFGFQPYPAPSFGAPPPAAAAAMYQQLPFPQRPPPPPLHFMPPAQQQQPVTANSSHLHASAPLTPPSKPYHELPAGLMLLAKSEDYRPMDTSKIKPIHLPPQPSEDLLKAMDDFYKGIEEMSAMDDDDAVVSILDEKKATVHLDAQGWEKGYLDEFMHMMAQRKKEKEEERKRKEEEEEEEERYRSERRGSRDRRRSSSYRSHERRRGRSSRSRSYSRERRRSPIRGGGRRYHSHSRSRSRGRATHRRDEYNDSRHYHDRYEKEERGRSRYHRYHTPSPSRRSRSYSQSPSPPPRHRGRKSPSPRRKSRRSDRSRSSSYHRNSRKSKRYYGSQSRSRSRSRSPPSGHTSSERNYNVREDSPSAVDRRGGLGSGRSDMGPHAGLGSGGGGGVGFDRMMGALPSASAAVTAENKRMGLGSRTAAQQAADEYESFRRAKSKTYNRREPYQPFTCYKCNKVGHLARECNSL